MDQYFNQMEKIVKERKTSSRIRFMLQDVIDLRLVSKLVCLRARCASLCLGVTVVHADIVRSHKTVCVICLFQHNWVSRRADLGPKTIEQIHKEAKIEEQEEQRKVHQQLLSKDKRRPGKSDCECYRLIVFTAWSPFLCEMCVRALTK